MTNLFSPNKGLETKVFAWRTVVDADDGADHLGHDEHVAQVGLDALGLLPRSRVCCTDARTNNNFRAQRQTDKISAQDYKTPKTNQLVCGVSFTGQLTSVTPTQQNKGYHSY